jgi:hypothetical protein
MSPRILCLLAAGTLLAGCSTFAQQSAAPAAPHHEMPQPTNLKVLPKDMTGQQVMAIMHRFEGDLGVGCSYCHAKDPETGRLNFASDANPKKQTARVMMKMTQAIDTEYLTQLSDPKPDQVTCGTCHRGLAIPAEFVPKPDEHEHHPATPPQAGAEAPSGHS